MLQRRGCLAVRSRSWRRQPEKLGCQQKTVCTMVQPDDWWLKSGEDVGRPYQRYGWAVLDTLNLIHSLTHTVKLIAKFPVLRKALQTADTKQWHQHTMERWKVTVHEQHSSETLLHAKPTHSRHFGQMGKLIIFRYFTADIGSQDGWNLLKEGKENGN